MSLETNNFQRRGSASNAAVGKAFEDAVCTYFQAQGIHLERDFVVDIGVSKRCVRPKKFDLGANNPAILVECKCHRWTEGGNSPSAKMTTWDQAMFYFLLAPKKYRKMFFVERSLRGRVSLAQHYIQNHEHMIPGDVEIWERDPDSGHVAQVR